MKTASAKQKATTVSPSAHRKRLARAGKRKCRRCKLIYTKDKGDLSTLCPSCKTKCYRCDVELTDSTWDKSAKQRGTNYVCKSCVATTVRLTRDKTKQKDYDLLRTYGISYDEYDTLLKQQEGVCWICKKPPTTKRLAVDHEHQPGEKKQHAKHIRPFVRGLLCWHCNHAIGRFKDTPEFLRRAADYLEERPAQKVLSNDGH